MPHLQLPRLQERIIIKVIPDFAIRSSKCGNERVVSSSGENNGITVSPVFVIIVSKYGSERVVSTGNFFCTKFFVAYLGLPYRFDYTSSLFGFVCGSE